MKKILIKVLLFQFIVLNATAQFNAYYPNGKPLPKHLLDNANTINLILDSLGCKDYEMDLVKNDLVFYKKLTANPVLAILDKKNPENIPTLIESYKRRYKKYLFSYLYYSDIKQLMDSSKLTKKYLVDCFGIPNYNDTSTNTSVWKNRNLKVEFIGENAINVDVINFNAININKLAISNFEITGGDYTIGFNINVVNHDYKTIKYVYFTVKATNNVDDLVGIKTLTGVGPIKKGEDASFEFEDIIYSRTAQYLEIQNIKLQYMDKTFKIIPKSAINSITLKNWEEIGNRLVTN